MGVRKGIGNLLMFFVILSLVSGVFGYLIISQEPDSKSELQNVQNSMSQNDSERQSRIDGAEYDNEVDYARGSEIAAARKEYSSSIEEFGIGSIYMPVAGISVPLLAGTSEYNLFNGVGTASAEQELGEGLFVGLSHNLVNDTLLKHIDRLSAGDYIYATDFKDVYRYQVTLQEVVHETDSQYFSEPDEGEDSKMLLYRCEGKSGTEWRRIAYADFDTKLAMSEVEDSVLEGLSIDSETLEVSDDVITPTDDEIDSVDDEVIVAKSESIKDKFVNLLNKKKAVSDYFLTSYKYIDGNWKVYIALLVIALGLYILL